jgi:hypothetical protein
MCDIEISCVVLFVFWIAIRLVLFTARVVRWAMFSFTESQTKMKTASSHYMLPRGRTRFCGHLFRFSRRLHSQVSLCEQRVIKWRWAEATKKSMLQKRSLSWPIKAKVLPRISRNSLFFGRIWQLGSLSPVGNIFIISTNVTKLKTGS